MALIDEITQAIDREKYATINVSIYNNQDIMIDSYDIWFDHDYFACRSCMCMRVKLTRLVIR